MGLDVYLYSAEAREHNERHDREWDALWQRKKKGGITEEQFDALHKEITQYARHEDAPSKRYPDHLFNRRYLRSSYNDGGFNHAVHDFLSTSDSGTYPAQDGSLYWIFEPMGREWDGDEGTLTAEDVPKLQECKARALEVADRLRKADPLRVEEIGNALVPPTMRAKEFLSWFRQQKASREGKKSPFGDGGYSCREGTVLGFDKGLDVLAVTMGIGTLGKPSALVIYRSDSIDSYVQSAEITAEFCDEAIALIERDGSAYLMWSG